MQSKAFPPPHPRTENISCLRTPGTPSDLLGSVSWSSSYDSMCHFPLIKITKLKTDDNRRCWETETYKQSPLLGAVFFQWLGVCVCCPCVNDACGRLLAQCYALGCSLKESSQGHWPDLIKWPGGLLQKNPLRTGGLLWLFLLCHQRETWESGLFARIFLCCNSSPCLTLCFPVRPPYQSTIVIKTLL